MKVKKAIIPIAGFATRFLPACKSIPKCMLNIVDKPIIQYLVEEAYESGIEEIILIVGRKQEVIRDYFSNDVDLKNFLKERGKEKFIPDIDNMSKGMKIHFVEQKEAKGLGHAVYLAKDIIGNEPFAIMYGDVFFYGESPCLLKLIEKYEELEASIIGVVQVPWEDVSRYGNLDGELIGNNLFKVNAFKEKPKREDAKTNYAISDRHVLTPEIFDLLENGVPTVGGDIHVTDAYNELVEKGSRIYAYADGCVRHDAGDRLEFVKSTIAESLRRSDIKDGVREYIKSLKL